MLTGIDHLVVAVPDLEAATRSYRELGFTVVPGGRHPVGTHNALIGFEDGAYVELIAFYEPSPAHRWWTPLERGGGLVDFCCGTDDLAAETAAFRRAGIEIDDPRQQSRLRPDGYTVRWKLALPGGPQRGVVPFLIEDETPREERVPRQTRHENRVTGIRGLTVVVADLAAPRRWYAGATGQAGEEVRQDDVGAGVRFAIGRHRVDVVAPREAATPLGDWLRRRGPSPWAVTLTTSGGAPGPLDPVKTLGARLSVG
jgi:catechol 2,3-dioxygenase-like lactoylglutathione lyase family enzyme